MAGDRTEKATPKRRKELRKQGVAARSQELPQAASLMALAVAVPIALRSLTANFTAVFTTSLGNVGTSDLDAAGRLAKSMLAAGAKALAMPVLLVAATSILTQVAVTRERPNVRTLLPRFNRLSPKSGVKRLFGVQGLAEAARHAAKLALMILVGYWAWNSGVTHLIASPAPLPAMIAATGAAATRILVQVAALGLLVGVADAAWARRRFGKQAKMSKQDVRDEARQQEVNPHVKGAIRSKQRKMSRNRMMAAVAGADVVLANPTHLAVALSYEPGSLAPKVVAKGAGVVAEKIKERARDSGVAVVENKPLARALHRSCEIGDVIPVELYRAVAEVLAAVYAARRRRYARRATPTQPGGRRPRPAAPMPVPHIPAVPAATLSGGER